MKTYSLDEAIKYLTQSPKPSEEKKINIIVNEGVPETHCNENVTSSDGNMSVFQPNEFETICYGEGQMIQGKSPDKLETNCEGDESSEEDINLFQPGDIDNICNEAEMMVQGVNQIFFESFKNFKRLRDQHSIIPHKDNIRCIYDDKENQVQINDRSDRCETEDDNSEAENYDFHVDKWDETPTDKDESMPIEIVMCSRNESHIVKTEGHEGVGYSNDYVHTEPARKKKENLN